ncbi:MAG: hypothetical protein NT169_10780 [Chloroflexi bacterium]|nr:hypothetical protein [Chloroflexota bacterium]
MAEGTMTVQMIEVGLPKPVFAKLQRAAKLTYRSVEELLAATINATLVSPLDLPRDLANELAAMHIMSDAGLWAAAEPSMSPAEQLRLSQLNEMGGERTLTLSEQAEQQQLLKAYYRSMLRRAKALAILAQRGHPVPIVAEFGDDDVR